MQFVTELFVHFEHKKLLQLNAAVLLLYSMMKYSKTLTTVMPTHMKDKKKGQANQHRIQAQTILNWKILSETCEADHKDIEMSLPLS